MYRTKVKMWRGAIFHCIGSGGGAKMFYSLGARPLGLEKNIVFQVTRPTHGKNPRFKNVFLTFFWGQNWFTVIFSVEETHKPCRFPCFYVSHFGFIYFKINCRLSPLENKHLWLSRPTVIPSRHGPDFHRPQSQITRQSGFSPTTVPKLSTGIILSKYP